MVYNWRQPRTLPWFPVHCRLCMQRTSGTALCAACQADLPWIETACVRCARPLPPAAAPAVCGTCQRRAPQFAAATALLRYAPPADYLVRRLKFSGELALVPLLADPLAQRLAQRTVPLPDLVVPVPLHPARLHARGFNQATLLARRVARRLDIAVDTRLCRRQRNTEPQSLLPVGARGRNVRGAFQVTGTPGTGHVAILDDVMTSGHTTGELARELRRAGVARVEVWVIARAGYPW